MQLQMGQTISIPSFTEGTIVTDSKFDSEIVEKLVRNMKMEIKNCNVAYSQEKISETPKSHVPRYLGFMYDRGEKVFMQREDQKFWSGPVWVVLHDDGQV